MTLDEAIKHAEEVAEDEERNAGWVYDKKRSCYKKKCSKCAEEHRQLAEWLKELKQLREQTTWIPVSERPPKGKTAVLISCEDMYLQKLNPCVGWRNGRYWETFTANGYKQILYPTAWMPRPKPYRAESEG